MHKISFRKVDAGGINIFYREAGPKDAPVILLLHGFSTSGHMFRDLIPALADRYRVIAPDLPGFGNTKTPPRGSLLYAREIPVENGKTLGDTVFASAAAAYDALPEDRKRALAGLRAIHRAGAKKYAPGSKLADMVKDLPDVDHPVIRAHPVTGRKALFLGRRPSSYVVGLPVADSEALLDALWAHATQPRFAMCHRWQLGDVLMWNNLAVLHRRDPFDPKTRRIMHRSQIRGDERVA